MAIPQCQNYLEQRTNEIIRRGREEQRGRETEREKTYLLSIGQIWTRDKGIVKMRLVLKEGIDVLKKRHILKLGFQYR